MLTGYGRLSCWLGCEFLRRRDTYVDIFPHAGKLSDTVPDAIVRASRCEPKVRRLGLLISYADHVHYLPTELRAIYTMWETDRIPTEFSRELSLADAVLVPSEFCRSLFETYSDNYFVENVGCGVDINTFEYGDWRDPNKLVIGTAGVMSKRKGIEEFLSAARVLANMNDVEFWIKTRDTRYLPPIKQRNVKVFEGDWPDSDMVRFYQSIDYFVLPTRGEGFGLPPIEAACCGTPGYVTNWSGPRDYIGRYIRPIEWTHITRVPEKAFRFTDVGCWALPSVEHLVEIFRELYNVRGKPEESERRRVSAWARGNFAISDVADRIHASLRRLNNERFRPTGRTESGVLVGRAFR